MHIFILYSTFSSCIYMNLSFATMLITKPGHCLCLYQVCRKLQQGLCTPNIVICYPFMVAPIGLRLKFTFGPVNFFIFENFQKVIR